MRTSLCVLGVCLSSFVLRVVPAYPQALPTSQPTYIQITMEDVKVGHDDEHSKLEAGWPAAFEKAKSPYYGIGMVALTGSPQAWFVTPYESNQAIGESMKLNASDPVLATELARLAQADTAHITNMREVYLQAMKDLSRGTFPDVARQRFYQVTIFRVRPGHEGQFVAAAKAYGASAGRSAPETAYRVYEVVMGMPSPTFFVISSATSQGEFDKDTRDGDATMKGMTQTEQDVLQKFSTEGMINSEVQRFRIDPNMCYLPKDARATDPAFWSPKKPLTKGSTPTPHQER
jgi:hypothetical protein